MSGKRKAYPVVGGPLDGRHLRSDDFASAWGSPGDHYYKEAGEFAALAGQYHAFNNASGHRGLRRVWDPELGRMRPSADVPTMLWVHEALLGRPPLAAPLATSG